MTAETGACLSEEGDGSRTVSIADVVHHHAHVVRQAGTQAAAINLVVGRKRGENKSVGQSRPSTNAVLSDSPEHPVVDLKCMNGKCIYLERCTCIKYQLLHVRAKRC